MPRSPGLHPGRATCWISTLNTLPITEILPRLLAALEAGPNAVLIAPPGAGKTTCVPQYLLDAARWRGDGRVLVLEPRRLAARAAAARMAALRGEPVGTTVGLRTRLDTQVSERTRIEVITEAGLEQWLEKKRCTSAACRQVSSP